MVRQESAKLLYAGSILARASILKPLNSGLFFWREANHKKSAGNRLKLVQIFSENNLPLLLRKSLMACFAKNSGRFSLVFNTWRYTPKMSFATTERTRYFEIHSILACRHGSSIGDAVKILSRRQIFVKSFITVL